MKTHSVIPAILVMAVLSLYRAEAQRTALPRAWASHIVVPQSRSFSTTQLPANVQITNVRAGVVIVEQVATTTLDIALLNPTNSRLEAELVVPVPGGSVIKGFDFHGAANRPTAQLLLREEARQIYDSIVAKVKDPALLEFIGLNLIRSSVFPVEAGKTQKIRLTYEHLLTADGNRVDYVLPRSESLAYRIPWDVTVSVKSKRPISTVYSPSHEIELNRRDALRVAARTTESAQTQPGPFRLSYLLQGSDVTASLFAYPDPKVGGGYFLLLAGLPASSGKVAESIRREVTLVIDRSGSMNGEKMEQVREAAMQVLGGLADGEAFNVIVYNEAVESFSRQPVVKDSTTVASVRRYLKSVYPRGGTNIHDALMEALRQKPIDGFLPIVLFLTDGLPTIGQTSEAVIRTSVLKNNLYQRRVYTFGVGVDVNTPLLENLAAETRGTTTVVLPQEDVEVKVGQVFKRLSGPVLASPVLSMKTSDGKLDLGRVRDLLPSRLPDLFEDDQLVLIGQYIGNEPLNFQIEGNFLREKRTFEFRFGLEKASTLHGFVPRLWASRKIGVLMDAIRASGANGTSFPSYQEKLNPKNRELVDEVVRLSTEFGILTEYTAFLAREGTDLSLKDQVLQQAGSNFKARAIDVRSGIGSWNQDFNRQYQKEQKSLNIRNGYFDEKLQRVETTSVQQVNDWCFYRKNGRWVDSRVVDKQEASPSRIIQFGSTEFKELAATLARQGRQGSIALKGDILLTIEGNQVLIKGP